MKILVLSNQKGGVGKSAVATQLAHYLRRRSLNVLVIDLDHQQNTSQPLRKTSAAVADFTASAIFEMAETPALPAAPLVLIEGDDRLSGLERQSERHNAFAGRFRAALRSWPGFDVCIVDTNPNPDIRYAAALISATHVLAPIQLNQEAISGIAALFGHARYGIRRIEATLNPTMKFLGILPNLVEATPFQRANLAALAAKYGGHLLSKRTDSGVVFGYIPKRSAVAEAQAGGLFLGDMSKTSARDAWREIKPVFDMILDDMGLSTVEEASA